MAATFLEEEASANRRPATWRALAKRTASGKASKLPSAISRSISACFFLAYSGVRPAASETPSPSSVARAPSSRGLPATCAW
jgi:hypothetical protein